MSYRLLALEVAGFRGFNSPQYVALDNDLVVLYAPNGHGKSSFCEAIEWALYGMTARKAQGEKLIHKKEFDGCLRNRHYPKTEDAYVALRLSNGTQILEIKRVIVNHQDTSILFVNGQETKDLESVGIRSTIRFPLILQHALRDFILAKPSDRFALVSSQLGLGPFTTFQEALQNASRAFKFKPPDVERAIKAKQELIEKAAPIPALATLVAALQAGISSQQQLWYVVRDVLKAVYAKDIPDPQAAVVEIQTEIDKTVARAFDSGKLNIDRNIAEVSQAINDGIMDLVMEISSHKAEFVTLASPEQVLREKEYTELARRSLPLIDTVSPSCPVCRQKIGRARLQAIVERSSREITIKDPSSLLDDWNQALAKLLREAELLVPAVLGEDDQHRLKSLLQESHDLMDSYDRSSKLVAAAQSALRSAADSIGNDIAAIRPRIRSRGQEGADIDAVVRDLGTLQRSISELKDGRDQLLAVYRQIRDAVKDKVTLSAEVVLLEVLLSCLNQVDAITLAGRDQWVEEQVEKAVKAVQDFGLRKRRDILASKSKDMARWFSILHPDQAVRFTKFTPSAKEISLLGEIFGEEVNVSSVFSEAQLNCLGLSFYAVRTQATENPFEFVVIDDPVQSMDQQHIESFKDGYLRELLSDAKQVLLLTHMQSLAQSIRTMYRHIAPSILEIETYTKEGPQIIEREHPLERMAKDIEFYMHGDSVRRRRAGSILRELLERIVKEFYRERHGALPAKYEGAMWVNLKPLIHDSSLTLEDEGKLFACYGFCASFPHDDPTKEPPTGDEIKAKLQSLQAMKEKYLPPRPPLTKTVGFATSVVQGPGSRD